MYRSNGEYYQMFFTFAQCGGNARAAAARYRELHPGGHTPNAAAFRRLANRVYSSGSLQPDRTNTRRSCRISTARSSVALEESDPDDSWDEDEFSREVGVRMQFLRPEDYVLRVKFSKWLLGKITRNPSFCRFVLWTDEALFIPEGCIDPHDSIVLDYETPKATHPCAVRECWSVHLWAGICDDFVIGPFILPDRFDGPTYNNFLEHVLPGLLEEIPLEIRKNMYFQHSDALPHYDANVRAYLDKAFHNRWIGRGGTVQWPPQSPEMNPLHFHFWEHLKCAVYRQRLNTREEVVACIRSATATLSCDTLRTLQHCVRQRAEACIKVQGGYIEPVLATMM